MCFFKCSQFQTSKHFILWNYSDMSLSFLCNAHQFKLTQLVTAILYLNFAIHLTFDGETFSYLLKIHTFWMRLYVWGTLKQDLLCIVRSICGAIFPQLSQVLLSNLTNYKWWGKVMGAAFQTNGNKSVIPPQINHLKQCAFPLVESPYFDQVPSLTNNI